MKIQVFRFRKKHPVIQEIREIVSDKNDDTLIHFVPPMSNPEIIFYIGNKPQIKNVEIINGLIKGQYVTPQKINLSPGYHFLSIVLHPFGLKQVFNLNASDFVNAVLDIKEYPLTVCLMELIQSKIKIDVSVIKKITDTIGQYPTYSVSESTIEFIRLVEQKDENNIAQLIKDKGIGLRTLQRNFKKDVGLTPKEFLRINRMNKIERQIKGNIDAMQIVANFDFCDQAHFVKEFKLLRSYSPQDMIKKKLFLSDQLPAPDYINL